MFFISHTAVMMLYVLFRLPYMQSLCQAKFLAPSRIER